MTLHYPSTYFIAVLMKTMSIKVLIWDV